MKHLVLEELWVADVPILYWLSLQTKIVGRIQSLACWQQKQWIIKGNICIDPLLPFNMPAWWTNSSPITPFIVLLCMTMKGWHWCEVIIFQCDSMLKTNWYGFLGSSWGNKHGINTLQPDRIAAYLTSCQMAAQECNRWVLLCTKQNEQPFPCSLHLLVHCK